MTDFLQILNSAETGLKQYVQCLHRQAKKVAISIGEQPCWVSDLATGCFLASIEQSPPLVGGVLECVIKETNHRAVLDRK